MSHANKIPLKMQAKARFEKITCLGRSKHEDKVQAGREYDRLEHPGMSKQEYINEAIRDRIYSVNTYSTYEKHNNYFFDFCKSNYACKTLEECRSHADEWLQRRIAEGKSAYTIATEKAALCKLYGEPASHFIETPDRERKDITRSRNDVKRDYGFSLKNNAELIRFCQGTGLRRSELTTLRGTQLKIDEKGNATLAIRGKGGRYREAPVVGPFKEEIVSRCLNAKDGLVWARIPSHMDVHGYRSDYATFIYRSAARPIDDLSREDKYACRGDRKGTVMDKQAMLEASRALGHNRLEVVAGHYIR